MLICIHLRIEYKTKECFIPVREMKLLCAEKLTFFFNEFWNTVATEKKIAFLSFEI